MSIDVQEAVKRSIQTEIVHLYRFTKKVSSNWMHRCEHGCSVAGKSMFLDVYSKTIDTYQRIRAL